MKKLLAAILLLTSPVWAVTYTPNSGLALQEHGDQNWDVKERANFSIIDSSFSVLNGTNTFTGFTTFTSSAIVGQNGQFTKVWISTPTYTISADELAVNGTARVGGSGAVVYVCDANFANCSSLSGSTLNLVNSGSASVSIRHDTTVSGGIQLQAGTANGAYSINGSNAPNLFSASRVMIGPTYGDRIGNTIPGDNAVSAYENSLYVGTHTVSGYPQLVVKGNTGTAYSVVVGTSPTISGTNYTFAVSTSGVTYGHNIVADTALTASYLSSGQCVQSDSTGKLTSSGAGCGSGGGGGASTLEVFSGATRSSPTASIALNASDFSPIVTGSTFYFALNPATTNYIHNQTSPQTATYNVSSGTVSGQLTVGSSLYMNTGSSITNTTSTQPLYIAYPGVAAGNPLLKLTGDPDLTNLSGITLSATSLAFKDAIAGPSATFSITNNGSNLFQYNGDSVLCSDVSSTCRSASVGVHQAYNGNGVVIDSIGKINTGGVKHKTALLRVGGGVLISPGYSDLAIIPSSGMVVEGNIYTGSTTPATATQFGVVGSTVNSYFASFSTASVGGNRIAISTSSEILLNASAGSSGQLLTSGGAGAIPTWTTVSGGGGGGSPVAFTTGTASTYSNPAVSSPLVVGVLNQAQFGVTASGTTGYINITPALLVVGLTTATLQTQITATGVSTGSLQTQVTATGVSTGSLQTQITATALSTQTLVNNYFPVKIGSSTIGPFDVSSTSATVTGAGGFRTTYGAILGSATISNLTASRCVETTTGGLLTVAAAACNTGGGGGGSPVAITTGTYGSTYSNPAISTPMVVGVYDSRQFNIAASGTTGYIQIQSSITFSTITVAGTGDGIISLTIAGSTYTVISSSIVPTTAGYYAMFSSTSGTVIGVTAPTSGGTPSGNPYTIQYASANGTQFAGSDNFTNNGTTITASSVGSVQFTNVSTFSLTSSYIDFTSSTMTVSSATFASASITGLASGQCMQTGAGGLLTVTGSACGTGGGGSGSPIAFTTGTYATYSNPAVSTPMLVGVFNQNQFRVRASGTTGYFELDTSSVTLQGNTNVALLNSTQTFTGTNSFSSTTISGPLQFVTNNVNSYVGQVFHKSASIQMNNPSDNAGATLTGNGSSGQAQLEIAAANGVAINASAVNGIDLTAARVDISTLTVSSVSVSGPSGLGVTYGVSVGSLTVTSGIPRNIFYKAAVCQAGTASLGFSHYSSSGPTASCTMSTSTVVGMASFVESSTGTVQDHFKLPATWTGAISADIVWTSTATSGDAVWQIRTACVADAELANPTWNTANTVTDTTKATASQYNTASIASLTTTGCASDEEFFFELFREMNHASDTLASTANLISLRFTVRSTQ